eukprot:Nitzschia sp. Nitz4//scaffold405_size10492//4063//5595//NITZ4_009071-RA/size10492-processed-gene-0.6-mRNA-1//1//CDS//3329551112//5691//frame0
MKYTQVLSLLAILGTTHGWGRSSSCSTSSSSSKSSSKSSSSSKTSSTSSASTSSSSKWWDASTTSTASSCSDDYLLECAGYVGTVYGDPHISTFDGFSTSCQAGGEFVFVDSDDVKIQTKFEMMSGKAVSVTTGVAISVPDMATVQVGFAEYSSGKEIDISSSCPLHLYIDGTLTALEVGSSISGDGYTVSVTSSAVNIQYYDEETATYAVTVQVSGSKRGTCMITAYFCLPSADASLLESVVGLLGTPDCDSTNEWMTSSGEELSSSSDSSSAYDYCTSYHCVANEDDSLFVYEDAHGGYSFSDLSSCDADFAGEVDISDADEDIVEICGGSENTDCILDGMIMGEDVAACTAGTQEKIVAIKVSETSVDTTPDSTCAGDITLLSIDGSTGYDQIPFTIVSQDTDSVTLSLRTASYEGVDTMYFAYSEDFVSKCISATDVTTAYSEEITVSCPGSEHITLVNVVASDSALDADLDDAEVSACCHADSDSNPKVKYTFMVSCVSQCTDSA